MRSRTYTALGVALVLAVLASACSGLATSPSGSPTTGGSTVTTNIFTNAPGGIPVPAANQPGVGCASDVPSVRIESDWPKANHFSARWGHSATAAQVVISLKRRDDNRPAWEFKPDEAGDKGHDHGFETPDLPLGIYDGTMVYRYPNGCADSAPARFSLNHGQGSLNGPPDPPANPPVAPKPSV